MPDTELQTELGPLQIDYISMYESANGYSFACVFLMFLWVAYLVYLLGNTAGTYFSPALGSICERLNLPYNIAGVTFLAMGNGAPDVFASITSFSGGSDVLIGLGGLLGASMFISSVAVGALIVLAPCSINPRNFVRDVLFHIVGVISLVFVAIMGQVTLLMAICYFIVYAVYVGIVVYSWRIDASVEALIASTQKPSSAIQAAFWHLPEKKKKQQSQSLRPQKPKQKQFSMPASRAAPSTSNSLYTFLILNEDGDDDDEKNAGDEDGATTINLSGGLIAPIFDHEIFEDHFAAPKDTSKEPTVLVSHAPASSKLQPFDGVDMNSPSDPPVFVDGGSGSASLSDQEEGSSLLQPAGQSSRKRRGIASSLYWQQMQLRRRLQRHLLSNEWWEYEWYYKLLAVIDIPAVFLRDATIPVLDTDLWSRFYAVIQPIFAPQFLLVVSGLHTSHVGALPLPAFVLIFSFFPAAGVYLTTHNNKAPGGTYGIVWVMLSFTMCISWIYLLAGELVACLSSIGEIMSIPSSFMGLTILAWGNSVGDFFANIAVGKQGYGEMAVAGCYGGPIFNLFIGLGLSFFYICVKGYPEPFIIDFDATSIISMVFLLLTLFSTLAIVIMRGYELEIKFGYFLICLYGFYTLCQFLLLL